MISLAALVKGFKSLTEVFKPQSHGEILSLVS